MMHPVTEDAEFAASAEPFRRELHVHSYRMLGSFEEAEDAVQETFLRAWRSRESFNGSAAFRAWLYRIATNVCLDAIRRNNRRPRSRSIESLGEVPWLQPYPDRLLDEIAPRETEPDAVVVARETIELAFLAAIQLLPPLPFWFNGKETFVPGLEAGLKDPGEWRLIGIGANRSPALATYLRAWDDTVFRAFKIDVMRVEDGLVAEITTFGASLFPAFGLAPTFEETSEPRAGQATSPGASQR